MIDPIQEEMEINDHTKLRSTNHSHTNRKGIGIGMKIIRIHTIQRIKRIHKITTQEKIPFPEK